MPPPSSFLLVTSFPYSRVVTQAEFNAGTYGNAANEVWFKYVPPVNIGFGMFATLGGTFVPRIRLWETDALIAKLNIQNKAAWFPADAGLNYWVQVTRTVGGASDFDFTVLLDTITLTPTIQPGDLIINDDSVYGDGSRIPAAVLSPSGTLRGFLPGVPGGEIGDSLPTGEQLWADQFQTYGGRLALFDADLNYVSSPTIAALSTNAKPTIYSNGSVFYVYSRSGSNAGKLFTVTGSGTVSAELIDLNRTDVNSIGVNAAGTVLYFATTTAVEDDKIQRWDLVGDAPLSDLYSVTELVSDLGDIAITGVNGHPGEILVLEDDSIVTYYQNTTQSKSVLLHIAANGTLINSYTYSWPGTIIDHINIAPDSPSYINIWFFLDAAGESGRIGHLNLATGALTSFDTKLFALGINNDTGDSTMFGPSSSCTIVTAQLGVATEEGTDTGEGGSDSIPTCCDEPDGGGDTGENPDPVGTLPPWMASCTGGGLVDGVADLADGESWL